MILIHLFGLSGAGKTTLAYNVKAAFLQKKCKIEVLDGDEFRRTICKDLSLSKPDRIENIRRLGYVANILIRNNIVTIISAISPYELARQELKQLSINSFNVFIDCPIDVLKIRDTKGLYRRAMLSNTHPDKIFNLTGIDGDFELYNEPDLVINTHEDSIVEATNKLIDYINEKLQHV